MRTDQVPGLGILKGITFAFRQFLRPKATIQYPEQIADISPRHRGRLILLYDEAGTLKCETCFQCAAACPIECIDMGGVDTRDRYHVHWGAPETFAERREESALRRSGRPVPDRTFDCAVASMSLELNEDLRPLMAEVFRVLRPGGRFVASVTAFDRLRPMDASFMGAVLAVVGRHAPGALAGRASRASIPHEPLDALAFKEAGLATVEEQDVQLAVVMEDLDDAWRVFSRTYIAHVLDEEGQEELRRVLKRRMPHTLYLPLRFLRTRRPG